MSQAKERISAYDFFTSSGITRPIRLKESTRKFAYESLYEHKYGLDAKKTPNVSLKHVPGFEQMSPLEQYNAAITEIVEKAPIRICENEMLSGAATLGDAINHIIPAFFGDEEKNWSNGQSHVTVDYQEALTIGMDGIEQKIKESLAAWNAVLQKENHSEIVKSEKKEQAKGNAQSENSASVSNRIAFLLSCQHCLNCMRIWHKRYLDALKEKPGYEQVYENLQQVPFKPARNFYEAVQTIWFCFAYLRLTGVWSGIGRIDLLLGDYLKRDLESGALTLEQAREILAHFFIKGCEWITGEPTWSGDAQHYQNIVLAGIDENGDEVTNEVTYLVLDVIEELGISDFPTTVRINKNTEEKLIQRVAQVTRLGGGILAVYNEDLILNSFAKMGYEERDARNFANDGCWEVQVPGKTFFGYVPFDSLKLLQQKTLGGYEKELSFDSFDALFDAYKEDLADQIRQIFEDVVLSKFEPETIRDKTFVWKQIDKHTVIALFEHGCIEKGLAYREGGPIYHMISPHIGGLADSVNSLYALKKIVFEEKRVSLQEFIKILLNNWEGAEELRRHAVNDFTYYGNDNDEADLLAAEILDCLADACDRYDQTTPFRFVSGVSTFGRQLEWTPGRSATPFGRKKGEVLSGNMSPTPGTDKNGATAIIKSYCKADLSRQHSGAALDIGLVPLNLEGDNMVTVISALIKGFVLLGGFFMQIDTVDKQTLIEAQNHPENYQSLSVRVSGWSARFVTMSKGWQDMIIERT